VKGLYVNIPEASAQIEKFDALLGLKPCLASLHHDQVGDIVVSYHSLDWPGGPVFTDPSLQLVAVASGWFSFRGRVGDLRGLALALSGTPTHDLASRVLSDIDGGAFTLLLIDSSGFRVISDPFGLYPHYINRAMKGLNIAPSPYFLKGSASADPSALRILGRMNHLIGNLTSNADVERLPPGAIVDQKGAHFYFDYTPTEFDPKEIIQDLCAATDLFRTRNRLLPLSGGLDSRLLLATGSFEYGYTVGPTDHGDRPIARRFRGRFTKAYDDFSFLQLEYPQRMMAAAKLMFEETCPKPFREMLAVFARVRGHWGSGLVLFDGYLGDVLTRWSWLNLATRRDQLLRPFPTLRMIGSRDYTILRQRYATVETEDFHTIADAYATMPVGRTLEPFHRLVLFEMLYGRGARYIVNGNSIMAGQFFTSVQPFFFPRIFRRLFAIDSNSGLALSALHDLWKHLPKDLRMTRTLDGYAPGYSPLLNRLLSFQNSIMKRLRPSQFQDYGDELKQVQWEATDR